MWTRYLFAGVLAGTVGCGGGGPQLAPVTGKVTLNGAPLAGAGVAFYPLNKQPGPDGAIASVGKTDENGVYTLKTMKDQPGAIVGPHRVSISLAVAEVGDSDARPKKTRGGTGMTEKVPARYMGEKSELKFDVAPGDNKADFPLTTKSK